MPNTDRSLTSTTLGATLLALSVPVVLAVLSLFFALWHRL